MKLDAVMPVRNDEWCLGFSARVVLRWCDQLHMLLHACDQATQKLVEEIQLEYPERVTTQVRTESTWNEMEHRQSLLDRARMMGATHIALVDADEALTANLVGSIRGLAEATPLDTCLSIPKIECWEGIRFYRSQLPFYVPLSLAFRDLSKYHWACRRYGYQHHSRPPKPLTRGHCPTVDGGIFHLQFARPRALRAKQAYYKAMELLRWPEFGVERINKRYSWWQGPVNDLKEVPEEWFFGYISLLPFLNLSDSEPCWQETALLALVKEYGRERFKGLDFFGVI